MTGFSLSSGWKVARSYLRESWRYIFATVLIFLVSGLVGFFFHSYFSSFDSVLRNLADQTEGLDAFQLFLFIFRNNFTSALFALFLGAFLGIVPLVNALLNGAVLGYVLARAVPIAGVGVIWRLVPHGIFELPAIFISIGLGLKLGFSLFQKPSWSLLEKRLRASLYVFVLVVFPLLLIAAVIESLLIFFF